MDVHELITKTRAIGLYLRVDGERLWVGPSDRVTPDLIAELKNHKAQVIDMLVRAASMPLGRPDVLSALSCWIGRQVTCPEGHGRLVAVFRSWVVVRSDDEAGRVMACLPAEVREPGHARPLVEHEPEVH